MTEKISLYAYHKLIYEEYLGKKISDSTWYRVRCELQESYGDVNSDIIIFIAKMKKVAPTVKIFSLSRAYKKYKSICKKGTDLLSGKKLYSVCTEISNASKFTIYKWFGQKEDRFLTDRFYTKSEAIIIISKAYNYKNKKVKKK